MSDAGQYLTPESRARVEIDKMLARAGRHADLPEFHVK